MYVIITYEILCCGDTLHPGTFSHQNEMHTNVMFILFRELGRIAARGPQICAPTKGAVCDSRAARHGQDHHRRGSRDPVGAVRVQGALLRAVQRRRRQPARAARRQPAQSGEVGTSGEGPRGVAEALPRRHHQPLRPDAVGEGRAVRHRPDPRAGEEGAL